MAVGIILILTACSSGNKDQSVSSINMTSKSEEKADNSNKKNLSSKKTRTRIKSQEEAVALFANTYWLATSEGLEHEPVSKFLDDEYNTSYSFLHFDELGISTVVGGSDVDELITSPIARGDNGVIQYFDNDKISLNGNVYALEFNDDNSIMLRAIRNYNADGIAKTFIQNDLIYYPIDVPKDLVPINSDGTSIKGEQQQSALRADAKYYSLESKRDIEPYPAKKRPAHDELLNRIAETYNMDVKDLVVSAKNENGFRVRIGESAMEPTFDIKFYNDEIIHVYNVNPGDTITLNFVYNYVTDVKSTKD